MVWSPGNASLGQAEIAGAAADLSALGRWFEDIKAS